jgi:hypothetical protein
LTMVELTSITMVINGGRVMVTMVNHGWIKIIMIYWKICWLYYDEQKDYL